MKCCDLMRQALAANERTERPKGLRRRVVIVGGNVQTYGTFYWSGRDDMLVLHCPFCGKKQHDPYDALGPPAGAKAGD